MSKVTAIRLSAAALLALLTAVGALACDDGEPTEPTVRLAVAQAISHAPGDLLLIDLPAGDRRTVEAEPEAFYMAPRWAPDGEHLIVVYAQVPAEDEATLVYRIFDAEGGQRAEQPLAIDTNPSGSLPAAWSPDGEVVAVSDGDALLLLDTEGGVLKSAPLPAVSENSMRASWSPSGDRIVVVGGSELVVLNRDGETNRVPLAESSIGDNGQLGGPPAWDGDVITIHGQFWPDGDPEGGVEYRVFEVDLASGVLVDEREETQEEWMAAANAAVVFQPADHLRETIDDLAPHGLESRSWESINGDEGVWYAFVEPNVDDSPMIIAFTWEGVSGTINFAADEVPVSFIERDIDAVGVPGDN